MYKLWCISIDELTFDGNERFTPVHPVAIVDENHL